MKTNKYMFIHIHCVQKKRPKGFFL